MTRSRRIAPWPNSAVPPATDSVHNYSMMLQCLTLAVLLFALPPAQAQETGVTSTEVVVGASQPLTGPGASPKTASNMVAGVEAYFRKINEEGGISGRKIKYIVRDSQNDVPKSLETTKNLVEDNHVFAIVAQLGTSAMVATRPYLTKVGIPVIGPIDGDSRYRFPASPSIFYIRPSFEQEVSAVLDLISKRYSTKDFALFRPASALGETMKFQYLKASHDKGMKMVALGVESENKGDVADAFNAIAEAHPKVVVLSGNPVSNSNFLKLAMTKGFKAEWVTDSPGMSPDFYNGIGQKLDSVVMTAVLPLDPTKFPIIKEYEEQMKKINHEIEPLSAEGYLTAAVFCEGLKRAGKDLTRANYLAGMNTFKHTSIGGIELSYDETNHAGLNGIYFFKTAKEGFAPLESVSVPSNKK